MNEIRREILQGSYWEHFNKAKSMALIYPLEHPIRKELERELIKLTEKLQLIKEG